MADSVHAAGCKEEMSYVVYEPEEHPTIIHGI